MLFTGFKVLCICKNVGFAVFSLFILLIVLFGYELTSFHELISCCWHFIIVPFMFLLASDFTLRCHVLVRILVSMNSFPVGISL